MMSGVQISIDDHELRVMLGRATLSNPASVELLAPAVRDGVERIRARAVRNVSGYPVHLEGNMFRVRVQTGTLKGSIESQWPYGEPLSGRVFVNGAHVSEQNTPGVHSKPVPVSQYAAAIEYGHGPIDLKKTMEGKIVPFFGARAKDARGPYAATGLKRTPLEDTHGENLYSSTSLNRRLAQKQKRPMYFQRRATQHGSGSYFITFRRVGKTGWVIPAARPRPFMAAALYGSIPDVRRLVGRELVDVLTP